MSRPALLPKSLAGLVAGAFGESLTRSFGSAITAMKLATILIASTLAQRSSTLQRFAKSSSACAPSIRDVPQHACWCQALHPT